MNIVQSFMEHCEKNPLSSAVAYIHKSKVVELNWNQAKDRIAQIQNVLIHTGVQSQERVCIISNTCKEWGFVDMATMALGAVTVPIYHSSSPEEIHFIIEQTDPKIIFVENEIAYKKLLQSDLDLSQKTVIAFQPFKNSKSQPHFLADMISAYRDKESSLTSTNIKIDDVASLIYTSGTSGQPKGVVLTHRQLLSSVQDVFPMLEVTSEDRTLTFLPLSHVLGRLELWGHYYYGYTIGYARSIETLKKDLGLIRPTVLVGVPRIFEKIYFGITAQVEISKLKKYIFDRALDIGEDSQKLSEQKKVPSLFQALQKQLAHRLVYSPIKEKLGGQIRFAICGGAPLDSKIFAFFRACGITILEGYGLTETTGPVFVNTLFENRPSYVGKAVGDVKVRFEDDGEILIKSDKVMTGYFQNEEDTRAAFTADGFFRTGDIGELSEDGFLKITDRKKDLIKTAGGKFVAPQKLQRLFSTQPLIGHVHIHGDKKKFIVALLTLDTDATQKKIEELGVMNENLDLGKNKKILEEVRQIVAHVNQQLASHETIKRFHILNQDFSIETGELTPSLKMKRKVIDQKYADILEDLHR